jgi:hypothetical protein
LWVIIWHLATDFLHSYDSGSSSKTLKSRFFNGLRKWLPICIRDSASAKTFGTNGSIPLIRTAVKLCQFSVSHPFIGEGGFNVSTLRTSHGGTRCHCSYPASRSLCFLSLSGNRSSQQALSPLVPPACGVGGRDPEVRLTPGLFSCMGRLCDTSSPLGIGCKCLPRHNS